MSALFDKLEIDMYDWGMIIKREIYTKFWKNTDRVKRCWVSFQVDMDITPNVILILVW